MNADDYCGFHTAYYFFIAIIGIIYIFVGRIHPVYNVETGEIVSHYSAPFIVLGCILIVLAFIGLLFFCEDKENEPKEN